MEPTWAVVAAAAVTGTLTLLATAVPKIADAIRDRTARKERQSAARSEAFAKLRRLYLGGFEILDNHDETTWINVAAFAADCIPYTEPDSEARAVLVELIGRNRVDIERFIASFPGS